MLSKDDSAEIEEECRSILEDQSEEEDEAETTVEIKPKKQKMKQQQQPNKSYNVNEMTIDDLNKILKKQDKREKHHEGDISKDEEEDEIDTQDTEEETDNDTYQVEKHIHYLEDQIIECEWLIENLENSNKTLKDQLKEREEIRLAEAKDFKTKNEDLMNQVEALVKENNTLEEAAQQLHGQIGNLEINISKQEKMIEDLKRIKLKNE